MELSSELVQLYGLRVVSHVGEVYKSCANVTRECSGSAENRDGNWWKLDTTVQSPLGP